MALVEASLVGAERGVQGTSRSAESAPAATPAPEVPVRSTPPVRPASPEPPPVRTSAAEPLATRPVPAEPPPSRHVAMETPPTHPAAPAPPPPNGSRPAAEGLDLGAVVRAWEQVVTTLHGQQGGARNLAAVLRGMGQVWPVGVDGATIALGAASDFFRSRLVEPRNRALVEEAFSHVLGRRVRIACEIHSPDTRPNPAAFAAPAAPPPPGTRASKARAIFEEEDDPGPA
jgi:hypothetical protein